MVKLSVDLNEPKDSSKTDKATQNGLDYGLHNLNVDADVLDMSKYVKDYKIILMYVEHGSSIIDTSMFDSSPDVNRNVRKEWKKVSSKPSSIGEVMKKLSKEQPTSSVARPIVVESIVDPFDGLDEMLGTSSTTDDFSFGKFKEVEVEADTESEEEKSDIEGNDTSGSDSNDLDYDPNHDDVHIVEEVHLNMNNFSFTADLLHDTSICVVDVQEDDLDIIDSDSFGSNLDDGIDSKRRIQLREIRRIGKQKNKGPNKYYFYLEHQFAIKEIMKGRVKKHSVETRRHLILVKSDNERVRVRCEGIIPALVLYVVIDTNMDKNVFSQTKGGPAIRENNNSGKWEVRTLIEDHTCIQSRAIKACTSRFLADHVIKSLDTNLDISVRAVQDQTHKQFEVGVSKMKAFRAKRITSDIMAGSYKEQYLLLREYAQELINQNPGTTVRIDVQQELNPESLTRIFRRVYVCLGALKQGFRACGREILGLDGCFMSGPWPRQILTTVEVNANNKIYPVAYAIVEAESKHIVLVLNYLERTCLKEVYTRRCSRMQLKPIMNEFKKNMGELKSFNYDAYDWLMKISLEQWIRAYFSGRAKDLLINHICEVFNRQLVDGRDQPIITCLEYIREYLMKRIMVVHKVIAKTVGPLTPSVTKMKWELTGIPCKHAVAAIYNMFENSVGVGIPEAISPRIPPFYKPSIGRPPKKRKKSNDEIESQSASSVKLSRKGMSVNYGKCGNVGHNRKGCSGQGGGSSQVGARKVSSQAAGSKKVFGQAAGSRKVSSQAVGARNVSGQAVGARKASSQPNAA
ncbi:hypothetical protein Tco_1316128 [Tanacetum coccineum]